MGEDKIQTQERESEMEKDRAGAPLRFAPFFVRKLYHIGLLLIIGLVIADLLAFFFYPETLWGDLFLATREQTPLTWVSALAMFFLAIAALSIHYETKRNIWYFLSATFFFFSVDDATYLHERISGFVQDQGTLLGVFPSYIWVLVYFPLLAFSLGALLAHSWRESQSHSRRRVLVSLMMLGTAVILDLVDGFVLKNSTLVFCLDPGCHTTVVHILRLTEEVLEVGALGILGYQLIERHCLDKKEELFDKEIVQDYDAGIKNKN